MVNIKEPLLLIRKSTRCSGSEFPLCNYLIFSKTQDVICSLPNTVKCSNHTEVINAQQHEMYSNKKAKSHSSDNNQHLYFLLNAHVDVYTILERLIHSETVSP